MSEDQTKEIEALRQEVERLRAEAIPEDAEERIAKWIVESNRDRYGRAWEDTPQCQRQDARGEASAILAALRRKP